MLNADKLLPTRLRNTPLGQVYIPTRERDELFVAGKLNEFEVLVPLDGDEPFHIAAREEWSRGIGFTSPDVTFQVDHKSARAMSDFAEQIGDLVVDDVGRIGIIGNSNHAKYVVWVKGEPGVEGTAAVAFSKWEVVAGAGRDRVVLFKRA